MDAPENNISPERWNKHFRQLLNSDPFGTEPGVYKKFGSFDPILESGHNKGNARSTY